MLAEAFIVDVVDMTIEGVYLIVEDVCICAPNDAPVLELAFEYLDSGSDEFSFAVESYFQLDKGGFLGCGLAFSVK